MRPGRSCAARSAGVLLLGMLLFASMASSASAEEPAPRSAATATEASERSLTTEGTATANPYRWTTSRIEEHFEPSYITLGGGINRSKTLDFPDLFYEAQIYVHYTWSDTALRDDPPQGTDQVRVVLPIRLQVRQYRSDSSPVKTPSYNPGIRVYYTRGSWVRRDGMFYLSAGLHHYSNGQSGPHYLPDGTINTENGSFSTDYAELSCYWDRRRTWTKLNVRTYIVSSHLTWDPAQSHYYERGMVEMTWQFDPTGQSPVRGVPSGRRTPAVRLTGAYKYGRDYISPGINASFKDNLQWTAEAVIPAWRQFRWRDVAFYLRYDRGYDYYNIHYQEKMDRVQLGIVASNF